MEKRSPRTEMARQKLADRIVKGRWGPGDQLPTHVELLEELGVSRSTLQSALDILKEEGFIRTRHRSGSFVADHPPHLCRYALAFPDARTQSRQNAFHRRLCEVARRITRHGPERLQIYHEINPHEDSDDYRKLLRNLQRHLIAGIIMVMEPKTIARMKLTRQVELPVVAIGNPSGVPGIFQVQLDTDHYLEKALDHLAAEGRSRIALITQVGLADELDTFEECVRARKMITQPCWMQVTGLEAAPYASNIARLLMHSERPSPPDGLLIRDDNLVDSAIVGLSAAGVRIGRDLDVVAHANFPVEKHALAPVKRIGYDSREILQRSLRLIEEAKEGQNVPRETHIKARMEDELKTGIQAEDYVGASR